ncbi:MAG: hypothetical protein U1E05_18325 [Patescibacteria group bacterium]|nr:hypothetical protein [Patescibacteria group bacterium]
MSNPDFLDAAPSGGDEAHPGRVDLSWPAIETPPPVPLASPARLKLIGAFFQEFTELFFQEEAALIDASSWLKPNGL